MTKQTKEVAVKDSNQALMADIANVTKEFGAFVNVRKELIRIPRLQLQQAMSPMVQSGGAKAGDFGCKVSAKNYGDTVTIIPLIIGESASLMNDPKKLKEAGVDESLIPATNSQVLCRTNDLLVNMNGQKCVECPYGTYWNDWGTSDNKKIPLCHSSIDVLCIVNDEIVPQVLSFRKTSSKAGKNLLNFTMHDKYGVPFGSSYKLKSKIAPNDQYRFYTIDDYMERVILTEEKIIEILPIAKRMLELNKQGQLEHETDEDIKPNVSVDPSDSDIPL